MFRRSRLALGLWLVLLTGLQSSAQPVAPPGYFGTYVWHVADDSFGGFSAIEVLDGGTRFVALSDKAMLVSGQITRDADGRVTDLTAGPLTPLLAKNGLPLAGRRADSEGLAIGPAGAFVSFENRPRVAQLDPETGQTHDLPTHPDFAKMRRNGALEALAIDDQGTIYTIPEETTAAAFPLYRYMNGAWDKTLGIPISGTFLPVAADIGPDNRLYLLERDFRGLGGFASQLRRFDLTGGTETTLFTTPFARHDNLEGLSVWRNPAGHLIATLISDDNFFALQRTEIVEYRLPD